MQAARQHNWSEFLKFFNQQNAGRETRLGVFEDADDYWLQADLPLTGVDLDPNESNPTLEIMLGNFTHTIRDARKLAFHLNVDGESDGLDITDASGHTSILRFER